MCPELLITSIKVPLFSIPNAENTPAGMAKKFGVPFLGSLPMDANLMKSCERGESFTEHYPTSHASEAIMKIVDQIIATTNN